MIRRLAILLVLSACLAPGFARATTPASDPRAVQVANEVLRSLGGRARWDALTGLSWTFGATSHDTLRGAPRRHAWNKHTGQHRVEGQLADGSKFVIVHVLGDSTKGAAWVNGKPIEGDSLRHMIKRAYATWVNDSYWFLMPYKLLDPGVTLRYDKLVKDRDGTFDRIALSFEHVGLTPGDHYWVDVNRKNHRVERWQMVLQGQKPPPVGYTWEGWEQHDGLWFPTHHRRDGLDVFTRDVSTLAAFPPTEFQKP